MPDHVTSIEVRLVAVDPPFAPGTGVMFGPQRNKVVEAPVPATTTTTFDLHVEVVRSADGHDFRGPYVHGKRGDRFLYVSWGFGESAAEFAMFARAKLELADVPQGVIAAGEEGASLVCELHATNAKGEPASGTIRPPCVAWAIARGAVP